MAKIDTFQCDVCQVQKQKSNHWFRGYKLTEARGVVIITWDAVPTADDVEDLEVHLCGAECVNQWLSKTLLATQ